MTTEQQYQDFLDRLAALQGTVADQLSSRFIGEPALAEELNKQLDAMVAALTGADAASVPPPDKGLAQLVGVGPEAAAALGQTRIPLAVSVYDETVVSERVVAIGDLYYIYQHETIGVFRVMQRLQELFRAGTVRLSAGEGAYGLYQFDRRDVLRYTLRDRLSAYRRALGYGTGPVPAGSRANTDFHRLFSHFKRNNLKFTSFGHLNVLRVEVMQLLDEAFRILDAPDIRRLFGADNAWDVVEEVLVRYFNERLVTSPRQRMAVTGREILRWLAQPHILEATRAEFEALLLDIAEPAEEWLTSATSLGLARRTTARVLPWEQRSPVGPAAVRNGRQAAPVP